MSTQIQRRVDRDLSQLSGNPVKKTVMTYLLLQRNRTSSTMLCSRSVAQPPERARGAGEGRKGQYLRSERAMISALSRTHLVFQKKNKLISTCICVIWFRYLHLTSMMIIVAMVLICRTSQMLVSLAACPAFLAKNSSASTGVSRWYLPYKPGISNVTEPEHG